jgi:hypothetical protein
MIYSWDISTSITGVSTFNSDGELIETNHIDLRDGDDMNEKGSLVCDFMNRVMVVGKNPTADVHVVEERLGNFAAGRTMLQTLMKLAAFNAVVSYLIAQEAPGARVLRLHPSSWKSIMRKEGLLIPKGQESNKKDITLAYVRLREPEFDKRVASVGLNKNGNPHPWCYDEADAYCLGKAAYRTLCREAVSSKPSNGPSTTRDGSKERAKPSSTAGTRKGATADTTSESSP